MRLDYHHFDADGRAQEVDHLLVGEGGHRHLADLHQPAALPQSRLPGKAERLHVGHDALEVDVEAELAEAVAPQGHLWRLAASGGYLEPGQRPVRLISKIPAEWFSRHKSSSKMLEWRRSRTWNGHNQGENTDQEQITEYELNESFSIKYRVLSRQTSIADNEHLVGRFCVIAQQKHGYVCKQKKESIQEESESTTRKPHNRG